MKETTTQRFPQRSSMLPAMIPDDNLSGIPRPAEMHVDYLSHEWNEYDVQESWKIMSKQKNEITNGIRLENASWRTWAKQKYCLRTVNPSKLNWQKDSDVTWLYGPLHTAYSPLLVKTSPKSKTAEDKRHKSCLKKKPVSEIFRFNPRPRACLNTSSSDTQLYQDDSSVSSSCLEKTHIRFSNKVEQYMAVDSEEDECEGGEEEEEEEEEEIIDDSDDSGSSSDSSASNSDDSAIVMKISRKRQKMAAIICKLEPTTLKSDRMADNQYSALYSSRRSSKHSSGRSRSTQRATTTTTTAAAAAAATTTTTPSSSPIKTSIRGIQSSYSAPNSTSLPYPTYSNSCASWSDELDVDDYTGFGVFAPDVFDDFDPSSINQFEGHRRCFDEKENHGDDPDFDGAGLVDRAVHIASNVKDIVHWCSSMVFNGQVF